MATISTEITKINEAIQAKQVYAQACAAELVAEDRLIANPSCPLAKHDYSVAASAVDIAADVVRSLGGNW